jgi:uncharacterized membrane protein YjfL (UPF0719 family)
MDISLHPDILLSSVVYSVLGLVLMAVSITAMNQLFRLDLRKEIVEDHNVSAGIVIAGIALSVAVIVAAAIH